MCFVCLFLSVCFFFFIDKPDERSEQLRILGQFACGALQTGCEHDRSQKWLAVVGHFTTVGGQDRPTCLQRNSPTAVSLTRIAGSEPSPPHLPHKHDEEGQPHEHPHSDLLTALARFAWRTCPASFEQGSLWWRSWRSFCSRGPQCEADESCDLG